MNLQQFIKENQNEKGLIKREQRFLLNEGQFKRGHNDLDDEQIRTLNIICKTKELKVKYDNEFSNDIYPQDGIWEMQEYLLNQEIGQDVKEEELVELVNKEDWILLHKKINNLFLDWIPYEHINFFIQRVFSKEISIKEMLKKHKEQKGECFLGLVR